MSFQEVVTGSSLGHFISLEGDSTAISEQLRLLPSSPNVLIFPALLDAIRQSADDVTFNAHSFVRHVHEVVSDRVDLARSFLQSSSPLEPRLVLANGGCLTARSLCLSTISDRVTNGNVRKAEGLFLDIVNDGVAGLRGKQEEDIELGGSIDSSTSAGDTNARTTQTPLRCRSTAFPDQEHELAAKRFEHWENVVDGGRSTNTFGFRNRSDQTSISTFADAMTYLESTEVLEKFMLSPPWQEQSTYLPVTPEYSEPDGYEIVGSKPAGNKEQMRRAVSVGFISSRGPGFSDLIPSPLKVKRSSSAHCLGSEVITGANNRVGLVHSGTGFQPSTSYVQRPSQLSMLSRRGGKSLALTSQVLSEHGNGVHDSVASGAKRISSHQRKGKRTLQPFEPVFAIAEDLIILFIGGARNEIFEYVVGSYKNGSYPIGLLSCPLDDSLRISALSFPSPPGISISPSAQSSARLNSNRILKYRGKILNADGIDHFGSRKGALSANRVHLDVVGSTSSSNLGTLALTPASMVQDTTKKFYEVESSDKESAVDVQNHLRALLSIPPFIQSTNPLQPQPVLANDVLPRLTTKIDECQGNIDGPINRMLALGCEDGVDQHLYLNISRQIEKLWCDTAHGNGIHVLDVRDPIINAMEDFTSQPLSFQAGGNPFSQPHLLAQLIVPHLEGYRSTLDPRDLLVLQYPESYFSAIIALRELLGSDALQVAGIVDVNATPQLQSPRESTYPVVSSRIRTSSRLSNRVSRSSVYSRASSNQTPRGSAIVKLSFSNADFLLTNTATESEISTFLSNIHNGLTKSYSLYTPDAPFHASSSSLTTMSSASSQPPSTPPSLKRNFFSQRTESLNKMSSRGYLNSIWSGEAEREKVRQKKQLDQDWENFYLDESENEDELERIFIHRFTGPNRASTKSNKALKWLGLT